METYSLLREFADSWMLLALFTFFVVMVLWVLFRPGSTKTYRDVANIPFRNEDKPAPAKGEKEA
ncbi:cbb3-type cytochrome c oxidase subunit 3 [Rhodobacteraceae bacterium D3-12]|nr:cbb3-type cytochrome c oxidase subunit 3 [Rhodobacteraceae bacterium D3-12]